MKEANKTGIYFCPYFFFGVFNLYKLLLLIMGNTKIGVNDEKKETKDKSEKNCRAKGKKRKKDSINRILPEMQFDNDTCQKGKKHLPEMP